MPNFSGIWNLKEQVQAIAAGRWTGIPVLFSWGRNAFGQLGDNTTINRSSPVQIPGGNWTQLGGGSAHTNALKNDGTLWAWGIGQEGRLGDGTVIAADTDFDARLTGTIDLGLFTLDVGGRMFRTGDVFEIRVDRGTLDFFGVSRLDVGGFYRSSGAYLFTASGSTQFTVLDVTVTSNLALSLSRDAAGATTFRGEMAGGTRYDWGWLGSGAGPSFRSFVTFGPASAAVSTRVSILGISIPLEFTWKRGGDAGGTRPDPVIARLDGGVLTLSAGDDPERYGDAGGQWYGSIVNETFRVEAVRDAGGAVIPGSVRVRSQGLERVFTGVTEIVAAGGEGNDLFEFGPGIEAVLRLSGGPGSDTFLVHSFAAASSFSGGTGYDTLVLPGVAADYRFSTDAGGPTLAPAATPAGGASLGPRAGLAVGPIEALYGAPIGAVFPSA
jgi:hypothetical protein